MSERKYVINGSTLTNIADAIRAKSEGLNAITPLQMPTEIANLPSGGEHDWVLDGSITTPHSLIDDKITTVAAYALAGRGSSMNPKRAVFSAATEIGLCAFKDNQAIEAVECNNQNFKFVRATAFYGCSSLMTFSAFATASDGSVSGGYLNLGANAFSGCLSLNITDVYKNVTAENNCFQNCSSIYNLHFHGNLTANGTGGGGRDVFAGCALMRSFRVDGVFTASTISSSATMFSNCSSLADVKLLGSPRVGSNVFKNVTALKRVIIASTPTSLHSSAFTGCTGVTDVYVSWSEGDVAGAPWGMTNATVHYDTQFDSDGEPVTT